MANQLWEECQAVIYNKVFTTDSCHLGQALRPSEPPTLPGLTLVHMISYKNQVPVNQITRVNQIKQCLVHMKLLNY